MKTLIILSCFTGWGMLFFYFLGVLSTVVVGSVLRAREQQIMKEKKDIEKLAHAIQRYYWLIKKGKSIEANQKALKKFISLFSNRIINSSPLVVEYALRSFRHGIFNSLRIKIWGIYEPYNLQFQPKPDFNFDESYKLVNPIEQKDIISSEDAISRIEKAFNEAEVKWYQNFFFKSLGLLVQGFFYPFTHCQVIYWSILMCDSLSLLELNSDGAWKSRSSNCGLLGKAITSRIVFSFCKSMINLSNPNAIHPWGGTQYQNASIICHILFVVSSGLYHIIL